MKKRIPTFKTDEEVENFVATADLSKFDLSGARLVKYELKPKDKAISLRLPEDLFNAIQNKAKARESPIKGLFVRLSRKKFHRQVAM